MKLGTKIFFGGLAVVMNMYVSAVGCGAVIGAVSQAPETPSMAPSTPETAPPGSDKAPSVHVTEPYEAPEPVEEPEIPTEEPEAPSEGEIEVVEPASGYDRDEFGSDWSEEDGCSTRHEVLKRDLEGAEIASNGCTVLSGTLTDPYTGESVQYSIEDPMGVQIDHVVPLSQAWKTGADDWSRDERVSFANDPANLQAVSGSVNQSKSDSGPSEWLPAQDQCSYLENYRQVVVDYDLGMGYDDLTTLESTLEGC